MKRLAGALTAVMAAGCEHDPAAFIWHDRDEARNLECQRLSQDEGHARYPGRVRESPERPMGRPSTALVCASRFIDENERPSRDEALLSTLRSQLSELAALAIQQVDGTVRWRVDAFYPKAEVAAKISVAAKHELAERGQPVSDRAPVLAAADLSVLRHLQPQQQYPLACERYFAEGGLVAGDAFLAVMLLDPRETSLHAGLCQNGGWRWLR